MSDAEKKRIKQELVALAIEKYRLSYVIQGFSDHDRWDLNTYTLKLEEGVVRIHDDDTGMAVITYENPGKWWFEYTYAAAGWERFIPEEAYGEWKIGTSAKWSGVPGGGWSGS